MYIGVRKFVTTTGIEDFRYIFDNTTVTYHNVAYIPRLDSTSGCMYVFGKNACCYPNGAKWMPGEWTSAACSVKTAALCEANKVQCKM